LWIIIYYIYDNMRSMNESIYVGMCDAMAAFQIPNGSPRCQNLVMVNHSSMHHENNVHDIEIPLQMKSYTQCTIHCSLSVYLQPAGTGTVHSSYRCK
jgi:hypothetical protein